jgi:alpha-1,2-glucosyltransferase
VLGHTVCTVNSLRHVNYVGIFVIHHLAFLCRKALEPKPKAVKYQRELHKTTAIQPQKQISYFNYHSATNIAAFPVLFFFAALFYTDVWSTVAVLLLYLAHHLPGQQTVWKGVLVFILGVATLFMRQTNVFWVAVYMGGREAVAAVHTLKPWPVKTPRFSTLGQLLKFYLWRYSVGDIHDPPLCVAYPDGMCPFPLRPLLSRQLDADPSKTGSYAG